MSDDIIKTVAAEWARIDGKPYGTNDDPSNQYTSRHNANAEELLRRTALKDRIETLEAKLAAFADDSNWFDVCEDGQTYAAWRGPAHEPEEFARAALEELKSS